MSKTCQTSVIPALTRAYKTGTTRDMQQTDPRALAALAFTVLVWGITPVFVRSVSLALGPTQALIIRLILTGLVFTLLLAATTGFKLDRADWPKLIFLSLIGMLGYYVFTVFGFAYAPAGIGTLIMSTQPLLIALLAWLAGSERLTPAIILGLVVSFAGSVLLVWGDAADQVNSSTSSIAFGCFLIFLSGLGWSVFVIHTKVLIQNYGALKITGLSNVIIMLPAIPFISKDTIHVLTTMSVNQYYALAALILIGATAAVYTWNYAAGHVRPSVLGSALYILPILALAAGWYFLNEVITQNTLFAATVILAGVAIAQYKSKMREVI
jgi:drug/metabolite transporter (DMT)-like permease